MMIRYLAIVAFLAVLGCEGETEPAPAAGFTSGSRLRANVLEGADGSRQFLNWFDTVRGEDCSFGLASDGRLRCLPAAAPVSTELFGPGGDCDRPIVILPICQVPEERPRYAAKPIGCGTSAGPLILHVTEQLGAMELRQGDPGVGNCAGVEGPEGFEFYATGSSVPASEFVEALPASD